MERNMKRTMMLVLFFILLGVASLVITSPVYRGMILHGFSDIEDYQIFDVRTLHANETPFHYTKSRTWKPPDIQLNKRESLPLPEFLKRANSVAFLVIKNDQLLYEHYWDNYRRNSLVTTFSITKAVTSMLIGAAIDDGYIRSVQQPVTDFVPEMKSLGYERVHLEHLLQMTAGMDYDEYEGNPFSLHSRFYYHPDLESLLLKIGLKRPPGEQFEYQSSATQLLGLILKRVLKDESITHYLQRRIWTPLGMEFGGSWNIDSTAHGLEKVYAGLNATAIDLAKIGRLYLNKGNWEGTQVLPESWIELSTRRDDSHGSVFRYQYGWWIMSERYGDYRAEGDGGQFLYVNPALQMIIVRLGRNRGGIDWSDWKQVLTQVAENA
jgi:CubicO group peptidase (beta-lactamase class C family)